MIENCMDIESKIRIVPDFPKKGIMFRDVTSLLKDAPAFCFTIEKLASYCQSKKFDYVAGIESRGLIIGAALAFHLKKGFIPIRKKGKLPAKTVSLDYQLEYGSDSLEIHSDALDNGKRVVLVDDLLATGGTILCGASLIEKIGGELAGICFVVDLPDLGGRRLLEKKGLNYYSLVKFSGD